MSQWNLIIDVAECHNCHNCVVAAKDELVGNRFAGYSAPHPAQGPGVIRIERHVRGEGHHVDAAYLPRLCQHCDDAPCVKAGGGAVVKRADGIVVFDPQRCRGRRDLVDACPYGAVLWNDEAQLAQTWFFDAHLLDAGWAEPRCVTVCPTRALQAVKAEPQAMAARVDAERLRRLRPELGTHTRVYYRNLHRIDSLFVAGTVVAATAGGLEGVEGAQVELQRAGATLARVVTNVFGDFRIDGLAAASGPAELHLSHPTLGRAQRQLDLRASSIVTGDIQLGGA